MQGTPLLPKLSKRELQAIAAELAADFSAAKTRGAPAHDISDPEGGRGFRYQIGTITTGSGSTTPRLSMQELATGAAFFEMPPISAAEGYLVETGNSDADGLLARSYSQNSSSLYLIDRQRYTRYYSSLFKGKPHHGFVGIDHRKKPVFFLVQDLDPLEVSASKEIDGMVPYSRVLIITSRAWSPTADAEFWVHCRLEGMPPQAQAAKLAKVIEVQTPGLLACRKVLPLKSPQDALQREFVRLENVLFVRGYKFAVLSVLPDQTTESQILGNNAMGPEFRAFLEQLGQQVHVPTHSGFIGGLDGVSGSTGEHSYYTTFHNFEIMYHVGPLLSEHDPSATGPANSELDQQHWHRKRHVGNDIVVILFCEPGRRTRPISLPSSRSHMNHVFIVVSLASSPSGSPVYNINVASKGGTHSFAPPLPCPPSFPPGHVFTNFILTKAINSERAAMYASGFTDLLGKARATQLTETMKTLVPEADVARLEHRMLPYGTTGERHLLREVSFRADAEHNPNAKPSPLFTVAASARAEDRPAPPEQLGIVSPLKSASPSKHRHSRVATPKHASTRRRKGSSIV